jgi:hypothetical protein
LAIMNNAAVNMGVQVFLLYPDLHSVRFFLEVVLLNHIPVLFLVF